MSEWQPMTTPTRVAISDEQRELALRSANRPAARWDLFWDWVKSLVIAILLFLVIRAFGVEAFKIPSGSMERTLLVGDFLLVNKLVYGAQIPFTTLRLPPLEQPERGDVIVFQYPQDPTKNYVKRLVGVPGDTLAMRGGLLYLNGRLQAEPYVTRTNPGSDAGGDEFRWQRNYLIRTAQARPIDHPSRNNWGPLVVPEQSYFVLGDNRDNSHDSRYWGFVADSLVRGRPIFVYYSYAPDSSHRFSWATRVRGSRIGTRVR